MPWSSRCPRPPDPAPVARMLQLVHDPRNRAAANCRPAGSSAAGCERFLWNLLGVAILACRGVAVAGRHERHDRFGPAGGASRGGRQAVSSPRRAGDLAVCGRKPGGAAAVGHLRRSWPDVGRSIPAISRPGRDSSRSKSISTCGPSTTVFPSRRRTARAAPTESRSTKTRTATAGPTRSRISSTG